MSAIEDKKQATGLIDRALSKSAGSAKAHLIRGNVVIFGDPEEALAEYDAALEINPNYHGAYASKGIALILSGRAREALSPIQWALRIRPRDPFAYIWHWELCQAHLHLNEYKEAIEECRRSMNMNNSHFETYIDLISAYGTTGQIEQASQALAELNKRHPNLTAQKYRHHTYAFSSNPQYRREIDDTVDGLRKGGVQEQ